MNSLNFRKDNRSVNVFKDNINDYTEREHIYGEALKLEIIKRGKCEVTVDDHGVDNSGGLIEGNLENYNPDKKFSINGKMKYVEIKTAPEYLENFYTFKVFSIQETLKNNGILALVQFKHYFLFGEKSMTWMLSNLEHKIYRGFSPNDIAIRVNTFHLDEFIKQKWILHRNWSKDTRIFLDNHQDILLREKLV